MNDFNILKPFFEYPKKGFHIREIARLLKKNHMTVRKYLNKYLKEGVLKKEKTNLYELFKADENKKFLNLKTYYNLEKIRKSNIVEELNEVFDYPQIILFGSFSEAKDDETSDVDLCIITNVKKGFETKPFEKIITRKIDLRIFSENEWRTLIKNNTELVNNIVKGIVLSDEFEVLLWVSKKASP